MVFQELRSDDERLEVDESNGRRSNVDNGQHIASVNANSHSTVQKLAA